MYDRKAIIYDIYAKIGQNYKMYLSEIAYTQIYCQQPAKKIAYYAIFL